MTKRSLAELEEAIAEARRDHCPYYVYVFDSDIDAMIAEIKAAREVIEEVKIRHPGENNQLAWAVAKYDEVKNGSI